MLHWFWFWLTLWGLIILTTHLDSATTQQAHNIVGYRWSRGFGIWISDMASVWWLHHLGAVWVFQILNTINGQSCGTVVELWWSCGGQVMPGQADNLGTLLLGEVQTSCCAFKKLKLLQTHIFLAFFKCYKVMIDSLLECASSGHLEELQFLKRHL